MWRGASGSSTLADSGGGLHMAYDGEMGADQRIDREHEAGAGTERRRRRADAARNRAASIEAARGGFAEQAADALAVADPWAGFADSVQRICELQAADRGLSELLSMTLSADEHIEELRATANGRVIELIDRAKAAGRLREDFVGEDLLLLLIASAAVGQVTRADAPDAWRRFVALALDAFQCRDSPRLPLPPSTAQMNRAMGRLAATRGCRARPGLG